MRRIYRVSASRQLSFLLPNSLQNCNFWKVPLQGNLCVLHAPHSVHFVAAADDLRHSYFRPGPTSIASTGRERVAVFDVETKSHWLGEGEGEGKGEGMREVEEERERAVPAIRQSHCPHRGHLARH